MLDHQGQQFDIEHLVDRRHGPLFFPFDKHLLMSIQFFPFSFFFNFRAPAFFSSILLCHHKAKHAISSFRPPAANSRQRGLAGSHRMENAPPLNLQYGAVASFPVRLEKKGGGTLCCCCCVFFQSARCQSCGVLLSIASNKARKKNRNSRTAGCIPRTMFAGFNRPQ